MKLRIKGDSLRLRLTQGEVRELAQRGVVSDQVRFGPGAHLTYRIASDATAPAMALVDGKGKLIRVLEGSKEHVQALAFSPDGNRLMSGGRDKPTFGEFLQNFFGDSKFNKGVSARLWDVETGKILQTFSEHTNDANDVAWSSDGKWIATGSADMTAHLWKVF